MGHSEVGLFPRQATVNFTKARFISCRCPIFFPMSAIFASARPLTAPQVFAESTRRERSSLILHAVF